MSPFSTEEEIIRRLNPVRLTREYDSVGRSTTWLKGSTEIVPRPTIGAIAVPASQLNLNIAGTELIPTANEEMDLLEATLVDNNHIDAADQVSLWLSSPSEMGGVVTAAIPLQDPLAGGAFNNGNLIHVWKWPNTRASAFQSDPSEPLRLVFGRRLVWIAITTATAGNRNFIALYRLKRRRAD